MNPKKIKGQYTLRADITPIVNGYTFTGADRNAESAATDDFMLSLSCDEIDRPILNSVSLITNNKLFIKKARILTSGAEGLRRALNSSIAASVLIVGRSANDVTSTALGGFTMGLDFFNQWQDEDFEYLPQKVNENYYLSIDKQYSKLYFDDYNIQDEYLGQTFKATLEMIIDTAGVLDVGGVIV